MRLVAKVSLKCSEHLYHVATVSSIARELLSVILYVAMAFGMFARVSLRCSEYFNHVTLKLQWFYEWLLRYFECFIIFFSFSGIMSGF